MLGFDLTKEKKKGVNCMMAVALPFFPPKNLVADLNMQLVVDDGRFVDNDDRFDEKNKIVYLKKKWLKIEKRRRSCGWCEWQNGGGSIHGNKEEEEDIQNYSLRPILCDNI
ncbi:hypothetical protein H5410_064287 [Solanum commersonii]|uniref:Uncharacterized protein n=1 Tax=Solanum commersonii TaxID=4109 RepID=A0A9J5VZY3_SOLCO|nr:hypothetical protein H5410_064287 [Solanum commersonii]